MTNNIKPLSSQISVTLKRILLGFARIPIWSDPMGASHTLNFQTIHVWTRSFEDGGPHREHAAWSVDTTLPVSRCSDGVEPQDSQTDLGKTMLSPHHLLCHSAAKFGFDAEIKSPDICIGMIIVEYC